MVNIQSLTAEIRRGKKRRKKEERTNHSMKIYMVSLFHRATINQSVSYIPMSTGVPRVKSLYTPFSQCLSYTVVETGIWDVPAVIIE